VPAMSTTMSHNELFQPGRAARAAARIRHHVLDQQLADGVNPADRSLRAARAAELTKRSSRERVAGEIEQLVRFPDESHRLRVGPHPVATHVNRDALLQLADLLHGGAAVSIRGLARLQIALTDGTGPLYTDRDGRALTRELEQIYAALIG
jgi:hypothetical protein